MKRIMNSALAPALSFLLILAGAIVAFAVDTVHVDMALGLILIVLGTVAFGFSALRLRYFDRSLDEPEEPRAESVAIVALSFFLVVVGVILATAVHAGHVVFGIVLMVFSGLAIPLVADRLVFLETEKSLFKPLWPLVRSLGSRFWRRGTAEKQPTARSFALVASLVALSFLFIVGIITTGLRTGHVFLGIVLMVLGGAAFGLSATRQWSIEHRDLTPSDGPRRPLGGGPSAAST
jgi:heme/copper-type cytochrome/quinol oxidase subunit 3